MAPNENYDARAWVVEYIIPFESLGLSGPPPEGTEWRLGLEVHDRDDFAGTPIPDKFGQKVCYLIIQSPGE